jgi:aryl carrier-like protein
MGSLSRDHDGVMSTMSSLKDLQDLIQEKYGIEPAALDPHASIRGAGLDSLALVEFLFAVEDLAARPADRSRHPGRPGRRGGRSARHPEGVK